MPAQLCLLHRARKGPLAPAEAALPFDPGDSSSIRNPDLSAGLICFEVDGQAPQAVVEHLAGRGLVASTTPYRTTYARLAPSLINNEEEVSRTETAIAELG